MHACSARGGEAPEPYLAASEDPFLIDEGWEEVPVDECDDELPPRKGDTTADSRD